MSRADPGVAWLDGERHTVFCVLPAIVARIGYTGFGGSYVQRMVNAALDMGVMYRGD